MTNKAQALRDFIKASKEYRLECERLQAERDKLTGGYKFDESNYITLTDYTPAKTKLYAAASRLDLDDLLDVVVKMATLLREDSCGECNGTGEIFDEASNLMGAHGWMTCWKCYDTPVATVLRLAQPYIDAVGE